MSKTMIIFLHGQDSYRLRKKLEEFISNYKEKNSSGFNFRSFEGEKLIYQDFKDEFRQTPMFKEKKLVILKDVIGNKEFKEDFLKEKKKFIETDDVIIFTEERELPGKDALVNFLKKEAKVQEFAPLAGAKLKTWVQKEIESYGLKVGVQALDKLINYTGSDLWQLSNEILKIAAYKNKKGEVGEEDVELLVKPKIEADIFKTIDAIAQRDKGKAIRLIHGHIEKGDSPLYLLSMINFQFRNILEIKDLLEKGRPLSQAKLHPFVARKSAQQAGQFTLEELKKIYRKIFKVDFNIKTGKIEPETALDLLIAEI
jgi:DNA polymerase-3 subunit delta